MESTQRLLLRRLRVITSSSPLWLGGLGLLAGATALAAPVQLRLAEAGFALQGAALLIVVLVLHAKFVVNALLGHDVEWWIVAVLAAVTYPPLPFVGAGWMPVCGLLAGALLLAATQSRSLVAGLAAAVAALSSGFVGLADSGRTDADVLWAFLVPLIGLTEYALVSLATRAHALGEARADDLHEAVRRERRRFTRDLHDLVGHRLTALVLKVQLIERLMKAKDAKAMDEVEETLKLLRRVSADVRAVAHGLRGSSLVAELGSARGLLESVQVRCYIQASCQDLPEDVEEALTHALREGVTNVLRHADARQCYIQLLQREQMVRLSIRNDGVRPCSRPGDPGLGLPNLAHRVSVLGGWLEARSSRTGQFTFSVYVPWKKTMSTQSIVKNTQMPFK
ncbi:hypothetical protein HII36_07850 [Nonomuraea sp. NN258]|uniref:sensor histidine kinase n=1 Tax=Nonomuraea antri TaxID=2730852 RepID=UPI0015690BF0|nr:histidine kinase [Nonomuraea antri]NRQ31751.1 hypothetical protein [Nonomuraea antri]